MDLVEAFLRGYDKGIGIMHNIFYPDCKVCVFDEDGIGEYKYKKKVLTNNKNSVKIILN